MSRKIDELSPEQEQALREKHRREFEAELAAKATEGDPDEHVYTNMRPNRRLVLNDLGTRSGNTFERETFEPGEVKDLGQFYRPRDIRASRHLVRMQKAGHIKKGRHEAVAVVDDPLTRLTASHEGQDGTFKDPLSGKRSYDLELQKRIAEENRRYDAR